VRENSILFPSHTYKNLWTINQTQITLYCEQGIKIFSKDESDLRILELAEPKASKTTKKEKIEEKLFQRSSEEARLLEEFIKFDPKYFGTKS